MSLFVNISLIEIKVEIVIISLLKMCTLKVLYTTVNHGHIFLTFEGYSNYLVLSFAPFISVLL